MGTTLVTGATGNIGRLVVRGLRARGIDVRAVSRHAPEVLPDDVQHVAASLTGPVPDGLFDDVDQLFLFPADGDLSRILDAAAAAGVGHVVVLSSLAAAAEHERDLTSESAAHHRQVEAFVAASGLPATTVRAGNFANNLLFWAPSIRFSAGVDGPYPESRQTVVHEADLADVVVACLTEEQWRGRTLAVTGPEALSQAEQLDVIAAELGRPLTYRRITPEQYTATMTQWVSPGIVEMMLRYWAETVDEPDVPRSAEPIIGRARSLQEWAHDHRGDFA